MAKKKEPEKQGNEELFLALDLLEKEKGIPAEYMLDKIKKAISTACKNNYGNEDVDIDVDPEKGVFNVYLRKEIVEEVEDPNRQYLLDKAKQVDPTACVGRFVRIKLDTKQFGRVAAQTARNIIRQGIRDSERGQMMQELRNRNIIFNHITYQTSHVYICRNHPLAGSREIDMEDLIQYPFITYDRSSDTNPAYTDLIVPYHQLNRVIQVSDRAASYSVMRYCQGFAVGSGYRPFDDNYSDIVSIPIKNGRRLEIGWIVRQKYTLSDTASRFVDLLMQVESVVL